MWKFFQKFRTESKDQLETELKPLIKDLQRLGAGIELNNLVKNTMRSSVLNSIAQKNLELPQSLNTVRSHLDNLAKTNFLSMGQKRFLFAQIKENRLRKSTRYNWKFLFKSLRTALASFLIFRLNCLAWSSVDNWPGQIDDATIRNLYINRLNAKIYP